MNDFTYYTPTKVVFGKHAESQLGLLLKNLNCRQVLLHYGGSSAVKSGLIARIKNSLDEQKISYVELGGVVPNPRLSLVYQGIKLAKDSNVDFVLAIGGGSVIDSAKAIGFGAAESGDVWDLYEGKRSANKCLPIGVVLTIAAAGSEMSGGSVITNEQGNLKRAYGSDICRPAFAIMNPELTSSLPPYQTASGCVDIMMHTMERYFSHSGSMEITDRISETLLKLMIEKTKFLVKNPADYNARAEVMWAGSLAHNDLTGCGSDGGDWSTHNLEHEIGGMFDVAHGAGMAAIWGSWARRVLDEAPSRFAKFATNVFDICPCDTPRATGLKGIEAMENFYRAINMPVSLSELGITPSDNQIEEMAQKCLGASGGELGSIKVLNLADIIAIYQAAK